MVLDDRLYTSGEVAKILGVSLRSVYRYLESGSLNSIQTATGRHRFSKKNIEEFLNPGPNAGREAALGRKEENSQITARVKAGARAVNVSKETPKEESSLEREEFKSSEIREAKSKPRFHYFVSPINDLKTLAKTVKKATEMASIQYAFTLHAGASLHHPIKPFTKLHLYSNADGFEFFKKRLILSETDEGHANVCLIETESQAVFDASYERGGFMVVSDARLYEDLMEAGETELARGIKETGNI